MRVKPAVGQQIHRVGEKAMTREVIPEGVSELIRGMSIRARMALSITCLDILLKEFSIHAEEKSALMETFWQFVEDSQLWKWDQDRRTNSLLMAIGDYIIHAENIPADYSCRNLPDFALQLIFEIDELGLGDLYGAVTGHSESTFDSLLNILHLMVAHGFSIPPLHPFLKSSFQDNGGWGNPVPRTFFAE